MRSIVSTHSHAHTHTYTLQNYSSPTCNMRVRACVRACPPECQLVPGVSFKGADAVTAAAPLSACLCVQQQQHVCNIHTHTYRSLILES